MYFLNVNYFEYDENKSITNEVKHGISFGEAKELWNDPKALVLPATDINEKRFLLIANLKGKCWSAIYTHRGKNIRLISVRRARKNEVDCYESI